MERVARNYMLEKSHELGDKATKEKIEADKYWEVADIVFVTEDLRETELLQKLVAVERERVKYIALAQRRAKKGQSYSDMNRKIVDVLKRYKKLKHQFDDL